MDSAPQIIWRNMNASEAAEQDILEHVDALNTICSQMTSVRVTIDKSFHNKHDKEVLFSIRVDVHIPGKELIADHDQPSNDLHASIHHTFAKMNRQLKDHVDKHWSPKRG